MKLCMAGIGSFNFLEDAVRQSKYQLESFFTFEEWQKRYIHDLDLFLLDSGAFSFMNSAGSPDWDEYLKRYIDFINENEIDYFFELDVDYVIGYDKVKEMTARLEKETHKQCIPVFHKSRGIKEWERMCNEYDYVAIGTMKEYSHNKDVLRYLVKYANKQGTKVHGLGFTNRQLLPTIPFYSVDSTSWIGSRFGHIYKWDATKDILLRICSSDFKDKNVRTVNHRLTLRHNFEEWVKYQQYCDIHLERIV